MKNLANSKLHPYLLWLNKHLNNLHRVSFPIFWGKYDQISQSPLRNLPKCPTQSTSMRKKKYFGKILLKLDFSHQLHEHWERFTVCLQSSMEMEPKHFRAILMRTLAPKNLQTHYFDSQDTSRIKRREARRNASHLQET